MKNGIGAIIDIQLLCETIPAAENHVFQTSDAESKQND
jgi:hypothetical protein